MAESKLAFQIASSLATQHLTDSKYIQGTYHVVETIADRDALTIKTDTKDGIIVTGSLVYVSDEGKSYRYNGTTYEAEETGGGSGGSTVGWKYKGEVATAADLPTGPAKGDIYTVTSKVVDGETVADGHNYFAHMTSVAVDILPELLSRFEGLKAIPELELVDAFQNYDYFLFIGHPGPGQHTAIFSNKPVILAEVATGYQEVRLLVRQSDPDFAIFSGNKIGGRTITYTKANVVTTKQSATYTIESIVYDTYTIDRDGQAFLYSMWSGTTESYAAWVQANYQPKYEDFAKSTLTNALYIERTAAIVPTGLVWKLVSGVDDGGDTTAIEEAIGKDDDDNLIKVADNIKDNAVNADYNKSSEEKITRTDTLDPDGEAKYDGVTFAEPTILIKIIKSSVNYDITFNESGLPVCEGQTFVYDADMGWYSCSALEIDIDIDGQSIHNSNTIDSLQFKTYSSVAVEGQTIKEKIEEIESSATKVEANPTEEATETLDKITIDDTVYSVGNGGSSSVKIYDNDDDTTTEGKLWNCTDGKLVIDNLTANYSELEIYYSQKDTSNIQYYKINTELITLPKTNKGMFYIFDPTVELYKLEKVEVTYNLKEGVSEGDKKVITITSTAGEDSEVIIERVYGKE